MQFLLRAWFLLDEPSSWVSALVTYLAPQRRYGWDFQSPSVFQVVEFFCLTLPGG